MALLVPGVSGWCVTFLKLYLFHQLFVYAQNLFLFSQVFGLFSALIEDSVSFIFLSEDLKAK